MKSEHKINLTSLKNTSGKIAFSPLLVKKKEKRERSISKAEIQFKLSFNLCCYLALLSLHTVFFSVSYRYIFLLPGFGGDVCSALSALLCVFLGDFGDRYFGTDGFDSWSDEEDQEQLPH